MHHLGINASNEFEQCVIGHIDYCCRDKISMLEIKSMAGEVGVQAVECKSFFWFVPEKMLSGGLRSLENDADAIKMSMLVDSSRIMHVYIRDEVDEYVEVQVQDMADNGGTVDDDNDAEGSDDDKDFFDSDYDLQDDEDDDIFDKYIDKEIERDIVTWKMDVEEEANSDETDYAYSDVLVSCSETDEEDIASRKPRFSEFNEETGMANPQLEIGMKFQSFKQFKALAKQNAIRQRVQIKFDPNNRKKCQAYCKRNECQFYVWASLMSSDKKTVQIKSGILEHNCPRGHEVRHVNAKWIANNYLDDFRADPAWTINGIIQAVKKNEEVDISRLVAWRAKNIAMKIIDGDERQQIASLHDYRLEILRSNPGSTVKFQLDNGVYQGIYVCLAALKAGFKEGCRPLISVDGCFLKGIFGGQLLTAVGIDANDCIYPIAYAAVQRENKENWLWFLDLLADDLGINDNNHCSFMSDRQKGLIPAIEQLFPYCEHRFCVRHIFTNFRNRFKGKEVKDLLWSSARASYIGAFTKQMDKLAGVNKEAYDYLNNIPPHHWTRSHFLTHIKCDMLLNNLCESFNSIILDARTKGLITMCEMVRTKLMKRIHRKRDTMMKCKTVYCPKILKKLEKGKQLSWLYRTEWSGGEKYQVTGHDGQFVVDKQSKTCSCRRWDLTGIPCCHAVSALYYNNENPEDYIYDCYKVSTYLKIYSHLINPTNGRVMWPKSDMPPIISPEPVKPKKGRRQMMRRKEADEGPNGAKNGIRNGRVSKKGIIMRCSVCGSTDHNKRFHGKQGNEVTQSIQKTQTVMNNDAGQNGGSQPISTPHTVQWMADGTTRYPNTSSASECLPSQQSQVIDMHEDLIVPSDELFCQIFTSSLENDDIAPMKLTSFNDLEDLSLPMSQRSEQDVPRSVKQAEGVKRGKTPSKQSAKTKSKVGVHRSAKIRSSNVATKKKAIPSAATTVPSATNKNPSVIKAGSDYSLTAGTLRIGTQPNSSQNEKVMQKAKGASVKGKNKANMENSCAKKKKIWVPPGNGDVSFGEWNWQ